MASLPSASAEEEQVEMDLGTESVHVYRSPRISEDDEHLLDHMEGINNSLSEQYHCIYLLPDKDLPTGAGGRHQDAVSYYNHEFSIIITMLLGKGEENKGGKAKKQMDRSEEKKKKCGEMKRRGKVEQRRKRKR